VPKLWTSTIEAHRTEVREAVIEATVALVTEHGLRAVTMLQIAEKTGIGRATLYKYFPDVESILFAWHERHVGEHLHQLVALREAGHRPGDQLKAVLEGFALMQHEHHGIAAEIVSLLHRGEHAARAQQHLSKLIRDLLTECAKARLVRSDIPADELASYCLHALSGASALRTKAAVKRLVEATMGGLRPPRG
jgi:AcrR family transcriptional regulator